MKFIVGRLIYVLLLTSSILFLDGFAMYLTMGVLSFIWLAIVGLGSANIRWDFFVKSVHSVPAGNLVLTFDDGPNEEYTPLVLDVLKKHNVKAHFFVIGKQCAMQKDLLKRIVEEGHQLGNHSFSHARNLGFTPTKKIVEDLKKTNTIIEEVSGEVPVYFRPPFGVTSPSISKAIKRTGMVSMGWTLRSLDTVAKSSQELLESLKKKTTTNGQIVLLHDRCKVTVDVLDDYIRFCKSKDLKFAILSSKK
jgi:peptidoglycan/xylan/chitin deacetylase (PgdA/CDA1 family)